MVTRKSVGAKQSLPPLPSGGAPSSGATSGHEGLVSVGGLGWILTDDGRRRPAGSTARRTRRDLSGPIESTPAPAHVLANDRPEHLSSPTARGDRVVRRRSTSPVAASPAGRGRAGSRSGGPCSISSRFDVVNDPSLSLTGGDRSVSSTSTKPSMPRRRGRHRIGSSARGGGYEGQANLVGLVGLKNATRTSKSSMSRCRAAAPPSDGRTTAIKAIDALPSPRNRRCARTAASKMALQMDNSRRLKTSPASTSPSNPRSTRTASWRSPDCSSSIAPRPST